MQLAGFGLYQASVIVVIGFVIGFVIAGWLFPFNSPINYFNIEIGPQLNWFLMELPNLKRTSILFS